MGNALESTCSASSAQAIVRDATNTCSASKNDPEMRRSMEISTTLDKQDRIDEWSGKIDNNQSALMRYCTAGDRFQDGPDRPHNFVADVADGQSIVINNKGDSVIVDDDFQSNMGFGLGEADEIFQGEKSALEERSNGVYGGYGSKGQKLKFGGGGSRIVGGERHRPRGGGRSSNVQL